MSVLMGKAPTKELWLDLMNLQCFLRHYFHHQPHHHCHHLRPRCNLAHQAEERLSLHSSYLVNILSAKILFLATHLVSGTLTISVLAAYRVALRTVTASSNISPSIIFTSIIVNGLCHYMMVSLWSPSTFIIIIYSIFHIYLFLVPVIAAGSLILPLAAHISTFCIGNMSILWKTKVKSFWFCDKAIQWLLPMWNMALDILPPPVFPPKES